MKVGRNDPCPCGSGRKYKKCCLEKDEAAQRNEAARERQAAVERRPPIEPEAGAVGSPAETSPAPWESTDAGADPEAGDSFSPAERAREARWQAFEDADFDGRAELFEQTLGQPELMDADLAFDMVTEMTAFVGTPERRERVGGLMDQLRERLPEVYDQDAGYYLSEQMAYAIADGRSERVGELAMRLAGRGDRDIEAFSRVYDQLAYHGRLDALLPAMRAAWPAVRDSEGILGWAINQFANRGADCAIFDWIERHPSAREIDTELREAVGFFFPDLGPRRARRLEAYVAHLAGWSQDRWALSDFEFLAHPPSDEPEEDVDDIDDDWDEEEDEDEGDGDERNEADERDEEEEEEEEDDPDRSRLLYLGLDFVHYARRVEGVPHTRASMFRTNYNRYLFERRAGELHRSANPSAAMARRAQERKHRRKGQGRHKPRPNPRRKPQGPEHVLCPDQPSMEAYVADLLSSADTQVYDAVATMELLPAWLRFLESRGLLDAARRMKVLKGIQVSAAGLLRRLEGWHDPALVRALERWDADAGLPPPPGRR